MREKNCFGIGSHFIGESCNVYDWSLRYYEPDEFNFSDGLQGGEMESVNKVHYDRRSFPTFPLCFLCHFRHGWRGNLHRRESPRCLANYSLADAHFFGISHICCFLACFVDLQDFQEGRLQGKMDEIGGKD